jgi:hypothetical protein
MRDNVVAVPTFKPPETEHTLRRNIARQSFARELNESARCIARVTHIKNLRTSRTATIFITKTKINVSFIRTAEVATPNVSKIVRVRSTGSSDLEKLLSNSPK